MLILARGIAAVGFSADRSKSLAVQYMTAQPKVRFKRSQPDKTHLSYFLRVHGM